MQYLPHSFKYIYVGDSLKKSLKPKNTIEKSIVILVIKYEIKKNFKSFSSASIASKKLVFIINNFNLIYHL